MKILDKYFRIIPRPILRFVRNCWLFIQDQRDRFCLEKNELIPPRALHYVGGGDFKTIGHTFVRHFTNVCDLKPNEKIIDIGCGTGRMAIPLLDYLNENGSYVGFDISQKAIRWCQDKISSRNNNFSFHYADIYNKEYNPKGTILADKYIFPCEDESVDFAFATSLFTHLQEKDVQNYLSEIRRILKPTGRAFLNFFIIDEVAKRLMDDGKASMNFNVKLESYYTVDAQTPERAIAYPEKKIKHFLYEAELKLVAPIYYGSWSGRPAMLDSQDIIICRK